MPHPAPAAPYLSVVIPAYNEAGNFSRGALSQVTSFLNSQNYDWELLLVNDGSTDNTSTLLADFASTDKRIIALDLPHRGKAASITSGVEHSRGEIILFTDLDQATPIAELPRLLSKFSQGYDIVIGSRSGRKGAPLFRQVLAYGMIALRTLVLRLPYKDTQCGFKAFSRPSALKIFGILKSVHKFPVVSGPAVNPGFDVELLYVGRKLGYKIAQVPVAWLHQDSKRVRFVKDAVSGLQELFLVRYRSLVNTYRI